MCLRFWNLWATGTNKKYRKGALTRKLRHLKYAVTISECGTIRLPRPQNPFPLLS